MAYPLTGTAKTTAAISTATPAPQKLATGPRTWEPLPSYDRSGAVYARGLALTSSAPTALTYGIPATAPAVISAVSPTVALAMAVPTADAAAGALPPVKPSLVTAVPVAQTTASSAQPAKALTWKMLAAGPTASSAAPAVLAGGSIGVPPADALEDLVAPTASVALKAPPIVVQAGSLAPRPLIGFRVPPASTVAQGVPPDAQAPDVFSVPPATVAAAGTAVSTHVALPGTASIAYLGGPQGSLSLPTSLALTIEGSATLDTTPSTLVATLIGATPGDTVNFSIDGTALTTQVANPSGQVGPMSFEIPQLTAGTHVLSAATATQAPADASFTVAQAAAALPSAPPADTGATEVPQEFVVRHWVLQDAAPSGIGSWVMPMNPSSMDPIPRSRVLDAQHATHATGSFSISESQDLPQDWSFAGFCPDQAFYDKLVAYAGLNRRFYLVDHRGRAFIVAPVGVDLVPRKRGIDDSGQFIDWRHDYTMKLVVYGQTELVTA